MAAHVVPIDPLGERDPSGAIPIIAHDRLALILSGRDVIHTAGVLTLALLPSGPEPDHIPLSGAAKGVAYTIDPSQA